MNKTFQIFAVIAVFQDEPEAITALKASFYNQQDKKIPNILQNVFFLVTFRKCLKTF